MSLNAVAKETVKGKAFSSLTSQKTVVVTGAAVDTDIAVTGIMPGDVIMSCIGHDPDGVSLAVQVIDLTSEVTITEAGVIQLDTTNTTAYRLVLTYRKA